VTRWRCPPENWQADCFLSRLARGHAAMQSQRLGHLLADGVHGVERGHRLLEDHADAVAADRAHLPVGAGRELLAFEADAARHLRAFGQQAHHGHHRDRLAATRFADDAQCVAAIERKAHVAHGIGGAAMRVQKHREIFDFEQRRHQRFLASFGS
jgi:hypothetical protein